LSHRWHDSKAGFFYGRALALLIALCAVGVGGMYVTAPPRASALIVLDDEELEYSGGPSSGGTVEEDGDPGSDDGYLGSEPSNAVPDPTATEDPFEGWILEGELDDGPGLGSWGSPKQLKQLFDEGVSYFFEEANGDCGSIWSRLVGAKKTSVAIGAANSRASRVNELTEAFSLCMVDRDAQTQAPEPEPATPPRRHLKAAGRHRKAIGRKGGKRAGRS
jgi:hypothetical protein